MQCDQQRDVGRIAADPEQPPHEAKDEQRDRCPVGVMIREQVVRTKCGAAGDEVPVVGLEPLRSRQREPTRIRGDRRENKDVERET